MRRSAGFSLIETNVGTFVFFLILVCCFSMFKAASDSWLLGMKRHTLQSTVRRVTTLIESDLLKSSFPSVSAQRSYDSSGGNLERDAVCLAGIDNWERTSFDQDFLTPGWNVYILYLATGETEFDEKLDSRGSSGSGRIMRLVIRPKGDAWGPYDFDGNGDRQPDQWADFGTICAQLRSNPDNYAEIARAYSAASFNPRATLLGSVRRFKVDLGSGTCTVRISYEGRQKVRTEDEKEGFESIGVDFNIMPRNSIR
jgi:hypothetical protein